MTSRWLSLGLATLALAQSGSSAIVHAAASAQLATVPPRAAQPQARPQLSRPPIYLEKRIDELGRGFNGRAGIAVQSINENWSTSWNGNELNPQQSVSKLWVAITALDAVDKGRVRLEDQVTLTRGDLTLFHQPIAAKIMGGGTTMTLGELMFQALTKSDNTCNDKLMRSVGGPETVRAMIQAKGIDGIRFYNGERSLQSRIAGLTWSPSYSIGNAFYEARNALPMSVRRAAFNRYVEDPYDGASANGIVHALARLKRGELLSPGSTARLLRIMSQTSTGKNRLKGGLKPGWSLSHKTGTGQVLGSVQAGYNDIGILTAPDGHSYSVAVMIKKTSTPLETRMTLMNNVVRAVINQHEMRYSASISL
jgi:beta-lactamase class A